MPEPQEYIEDKTTSESVLFSENYPIFFLHSDRIYLRFSSPTKILQIYGQDYGNGSWEWYSSQFESPVSYLESILQNPAYVRISTDEFRAVQKRYLEFHKKLCC